MSKNTLPKLGLLYLDHVMRFFDKSNFKGWPDKIETVVYHWGNDKSRLIDEIKRKKIEILVGNIPATAYETFREISRALPNVRFLPSLDTQFSNKSKENVTHFCEKYQIPIPPTNIFYELADADTFLKTTTYPKIIKKSYGPSNYGGYFVHKADSYKEAKDLLAQKKYYPVYVQDFVPMSADIRVMLIGHKPVCAFWRRPPEGDWLTNTSQGGSMDYQDVPTEVLDLAVKVSKAANAEYWACDIAVGIDGKLRILECATAFAAFPYIRDWIGQYIMWNISDGQFRLPHIPLYNWEELGKISPSLLRTMRYITFGKHVFPSCDSGETFSKISEDNYPIVALDEDMSNEEWPSEKWNRQDNYVRRQNSDKSAANVPHSAPKAKDITEAPADIAIDKAAASDGEIPASDETNESPLN
ncbi:hypothetical protein Q4575_17070 [Psychrosphaera sp. 1_MG-2023]|uniref:ATP-grasp domain-containing protein n=1 Tax=Psychrosphaera sp. 1_MG-2023 TaxID=3062643 RepID=UPI0026E19810|nr:hypothetical protein [Psychrosphaera sp. 1_MG-2023]MDO6721125.1 hypothetical protein [Psychrosphaera sp. 1_MG-2023]